MNIHMGRQTASQPVGEIDIDKMKRFIAYAKACVTRTLSLHRGLI